MKELLEAMFALPLAMARVGVQQLQSFMDQTRNSAFNREASKSFRSFSHESLWPDLKSTEESSYNDHRQVQSTTSRAEFSAEPVLPHTLPQPFTRSANLAKASTADSPKQFSLGRLDVSTMIVVGDSLTAGIGDFCISATTQQYSFPAQLAKHLQAKFRQTLIEPPGIPLSSSPGNCRPPLLSQSTVTFPATLSCSDFSVPGITLHECLRSKPTIPMFDQTDSRQTLLNIILGDAASNASCPGSATQLECAVARQPTFAIFAIGFSQVLDACLASRPEQLPDVTCFEKDLLAALKLLTRGETEVLLCNVPSPFDTAAFSSIHSAAACLRVSTSWLVSRYGLTDRDQITVAGLLEIGSQIIQKQFRPLDDRHVLEARKVIQIESTLERLNKAILKATEHHEQVSHGDVAAWFHEVAQHGVEISDLRLSANYLGGIFGLSGHSMGATGQALLCNHLIHSINETFEADIHAIRLDTLISNDPVLRMQAASGQLWTEDELAFLESPPNHPSIRTAESFGSSVRSFEQLEAAYVKSFLSPPSPSLQLPDGLEQVVDLNPSLSFHCDAMRVIHCRNSGEVQWGTCAEDLFDGLAMFGSALQGQLHIRFTPPVADETTFEVRILERLKADDGTLSTPGFFSFPLQGCQVSQPASMICTGRLNLSTGDVSQLDCPLIFQNSGLTALQRMNPRAFPTPAIIRFKQSIPPTEGYGTAVARFKQRSDGKLDFTFHGTAFVPMGPGFVFVLPFSGPNGHYANVPASGTQLHPQIHLNTHSPTSIRDHETTRKPCRAWIPEDQCLEFTIDISRTSFGDDFTLNHPDLGFAEGRSHLAGRLLIQFGRRFGNLAPFAVRSLPPAGNCDSPSLYPLQAVFPGKLRPGLIGHDAVLRFSAKQYRQNDLALLDDPFDIPIGAVDVFTGEVVGDFLHRGLLGQALFYALVRVEPRTPQGSFEYRGVARFSKGPHRQMSFQFNGTVYLPYQEGFLWPLPDLSNGVPIGPNSRLDPFFQVVAICEKSISPTIRTGSGTRLTAPTGEQFSFKYRISNQSGERTEFEYTNHSQNASYVMDRLLSADFVHEFEPGGQRLTIATFTCLGRWSKDSADRKRLATVQVSSANKRPYVSILVDGGRVSSVNLSPTIEQESLSALARRYLER